MSEEDGFAYLRKARRNNSEYLFVSETFEIGVGNSLAITKSDNTGSVAFMPQCTQGVFFLLSKENRRALAAWLLEGIKDD